MKTDESINPAEVEDQTKNKSSYWRWILTAAAIGLFIYQFSHQDFHETFRIIKSMSWLTLLEVFLRSRGNLRDVQAHLGVSYPTARQRFNDLLARLGLDVPIPNPDDVVRELAAGRISVDEAQAILQQRWT